MHNNYYFLKQLSSMLQDLIIGFKIGEIYSQQKNELTICLYNETKEFNIKVFLESDFSCLYFPGTTSRAKRNSIDLFKQIYDFEIRDIVQIKQDRSFYFQLQADFTLLFKMHGNRSNIVLMEKERVVEIFKNNLMQDLELDIRSLSKSINPSFENFEAQDGRYKSIIPTFGKVFDPYFNRKEYFNLSIEKKYEIFTELLDYLDHPKYFIHTEDQNKPILSLYRINKEDQAFDDPLMALNHLFKVYISEYRLQIEKSKISKFLKKEIDKCQSYINKSMLKLEKLKTARSYAHIGDIIMANLHAIKKHESETTLNDFYTNQPITIKLKPSLSPQHNAEKYYKKAKSQKLEIENLQKNIELKKQQISDLENRLRNLQSVTKMKALKAKTHITQQKEDPPFHHVSFMGYEILVGKNARKNEQLTFGIAKKDDMFLHAKDNPGSHVIIKNKNNNIFPGHVIEQAASYAAFYSKSGSESLIRVLYTPKKYVRKAKNSPPGSVVISQEKVLLVKPIPIKI